MMCFLVSSLCVLFTQMGTLNQEVSELTKGLHYMINLLQAHLSLQHCKGPCPYNMHTVSSSHTCPDTGMHFNLAPTCHLLNVPGSHEGHSHQSVSPAEHCSYSAIDETLTESYQQPQSSSPAANSCPPCSLTSTSALGTCQSCDSVTAHLWTSPSLPSDGDEYSWLKSDNNLLDPSSSSRYHPYVPSELYVSLSQNSHEDIDVLMSAPASQNLIQDTSILQIEEPVSASPPTLPCLDSETIWSDALESNLPLGHPSAIEHPSMECLLGTGSSMESRDSESASSQRSSNGFYTASTEQSWCQDLTD